MTSAMQRAPSLCNACVEGYERERAEMTSSQLALRPPEQPMSQWLQIGTPSSARPLDRAQEKSREADELRRRWRDRCAQLHSHGRPSLVTCSEWNGASVLGSMQALPVRPSVQQLGPGGTVDTDLALGPAPARPACDIDEKLLVRRLTEAVRWQPEAAAAVASTVTKAKSGEGKQRGTGTNKADAWVLFAGPDEVGKRNMAEALSMSVFGTGAITVRLGCPAANDDGCESVVSWRGLTALDRVAEAVRANPFRVVVLDGVDHADTVVHGSIVRAIESGRLADSHGRGVVLGSNIFVVMSQWSPLLDRGLRSTTQESIALADVPWKYEHGAGKRRPEQPLDEDRRTRARKDSGREPLPLDLNLSMSDDHVDADEDDSGGEGSRNSSSDLTVEHEQDYGQPAAAKCSAPSNVSQLIDAVDGTVVFKPVHLEPLKRSVSYVAFGDTAMNGGWSVRVDGVLCPSVRQLKRSFSTNAVVDGATVEGGGRRKDSELFPMSVAVTVDGH
uniref:ATPase AAA-type core domain-containing protein n=1 Tax=Arundo donax TaxID=35708 RepID=A0A0A9HUI4_ARUDO